VRCQRTTARSGPAGSASADNSSLTLAAHFGEVVLALRTTAPKPSSGSFTLPLSELQQFEDTGPGVVTLVKAGRSAVTARWTDGANPRSAEIETTESDFAWPNESDRLIALPPTFPAALHEAGRSASREPGRYAAHRVQVRGKAGQLVGTDGKQALVQGGFVFPFEDDLLVPAVPVFGGKEFASEAAVSGGLADGWLYLVIGPWQVWLSVDKEGRFPDVLGAVPRACGIQVETDDRDARELLRALPGLPGKRDDVRPVTIDLGSRVAVRARDGATGEVRQVPLPNTRFAGDPVRLVLDRAHLGRALALGFREFRCRGPDRPVVARVGDRIYLTATLAPSSAVPPHDDVPGSGTSLIQSVSPDSHSPDNLRSPTMPARDTPPPDRNGHVADAAAGEPTDPLAEAEALRAVLADATARASRLASALKQYKRDRRTLQAAWSSLRQLNLGP
jgi:hypothetical protein